MDDLEMMFVIPAIVISNLLGIFTMLACNTDRQRNALAAGAVVILVAMFISKYLI